MEAIMGKMMSTRMDEAVHDENDVVEVNTPFHARVALLKREYKGALRRDFPIKIES
jgi:hypothetical protein